MGFAGFIGLIGFTRFKFKCGVGIFPRILTVLIRDSRTPSLESR